MTKKEKRELIEKAESEGADYLFSFCSRFEYIKDQKFHALRLAYLVAREKLFSYVGIEE